MKKPFFLLLILCGSTGISYCQQLKPVDTIKTYDFGKMPPVYFSNKVFWEKNYNKENQLMFEGLKYNTCFVGAYKNYWPSGIIKTTGQYQSNSTGNWSNLQARGLCSVAEGVWKNFTEDGDLRSTVIYSKGKIIREE